MSEKLRPENEILGTPEELAKDVIAESEKVDSIKDLIVSLNSSGFEEVQTLFTEQN